jgi:TRAP-type mannitol/chloroaromatic compound transport system permease small subunit
MDLALYIVFFLPAVLAFMYSGWNYAAMSVRLREVSIFSPAGVPVFPLKALVPVTGVFLLLQGFAEIVRCILCLRSGAWPQRLHDVEETEARLVRERERATGAGETPPPAHEATGV